MADKNGHIDLTYQAISALTGWPIDLLKQAIAELTEPDPDSRHPGEDGRRLVLLDPENRQWGWRVVNHGPYREKARKQMQQIAATESGRDAERKRLERERPAVSGDVQPSPALTGADRLSDADADADKDKSAPAALVLHKNLPGEEWREWLAHRRKRRWPLDEVTLRKQLAVLAEHDTPTQREMLNRSIQAGWQGIFPPKDQPKRVQRPPSRMPPDAFEVARGR
jgi:hypothetical protein